MTQPAKRGKGGEGGEVERRTASRSVRGVSYFLLQLNVLRCGATGAESNRQQRLDATGTCVAQVFSIGWSTLTTQMELEPSVMQAPPEPSLQRARG